MTTDPGTTPWIKASASDTGSSCVEQRRHDGLIEFDSRPGLTQFTILLPFHVHLTEAS